MRPLKTDRLLKTTEQTIRFRLNPMKWGEQKGLPNTLYGNVSASPFALPADIGETGYNLSEKRVNT